MRKRRWIGLLIAALLIGAAATGIAAYTGKLSIPSVVKKKASVIKGEVVKKAVPLEITVEKKQPAKEEAEESAASTESTESTGSTEPANPANPTEQAASGTGIQGTQARLENLVNSEYRAGGRVAICAGRIGEGEMAMVGGGAMQAASLIKLYVAGCVYENYGSVSGEIESLLSVMIRASDNTACNTLVSKLGGGDVQKGMALVNQYCASHGFSDTHMGRLMLQPNDVDDNYTSVRDCCNYLKMAAAGQLAGGSKVLDYMKQQQRRSKIPVGVPAGVTVGNKTGELSNVENDAAIVYSANGAYVLCVMSERLSDSYRAQQFITRTSSVVYETMQ